MEAAAWFLPLALICSWPVVTLIRASHSPLARVRRFLLRTHARERQEVVVPRQGPVRRRIDLPEPGSAGAAAVAAELGDDVLSSSNIYVTGSGRVIDLDRIPQELRLLPLPRTGRQEERAQPQTE